MNKLKNFLFIIISLCPSAVLAVKQKQAGLGEVAGNLLEPVGLFSGFVQAACFILGASFLFATIVKYVEHRRSPLMVPIGTVVFLFIAGIILVLLPFLSLLVDTGLPYSMFK